MVASPSTKPIWINVILLLATLALVISVLAILVACGPVEDVSLDADGDVIMEDASETLAEEHSRTGLDLNAGVTEDYLGLKL